MATTSLIEKLRGVTRFGTLTVISSEPIRHGTKWKVQCRCDCGRLTEPFTFSLTGGKTISCGLGECRAARMAPLGREMGLRNRKHGWHGAPEYLAWRAMKKRCLVSTDRAFPRYGGRGIGIDPRWIESFEAFIGDVGPRPSPDLSLDRVDNDRGYWPDNVRWADRSTQNRNRRSFKRGVRQDD